MLRWLAYPWGSIFCIRDAIVGQLNLFTYPSLVPLISQTLAKLQTRVDVHIDVQRNGIDFVPPPIRNPACLGRFDRTRVGDDLTFEGPSHGRSRKWDTTRDSTTQPCDGPGHTFGRNSRRVELRDQQERPLRRSDSLDWHLIGCWIAITASCRFQTDRVGYLSIGWEPVDMCEQKVMDGSTVFEIDLKRSGCLH